MGYKTLLVLLFNEREKVTEKYPSFDYVRSSVARKYIYGPPYLFVVKKFFVLGIQKIYSVSNRKEVCWLLHVQSMMMVFVGCVRESAEIFVVQSHASFSRWPSSLV